MKKSKEVIRLEEVVSEILQTPQKYDDRDANGLSKCIVDYINIVKKQQAERINSTGIPYRNEKGEVEWRKGVSWLGTSDIHSVIKGRSLKIEIKIGNDKQSQSQKAYQQAVERAGGIYFIAKDFASFAWWYRKTFEK